ncbi:MAG: hypothetical protein KH230_02275 [Enterocloster asparagiformis]|nr:hypothetical protein [Enterocloster asparagiformis]
MANYMESHDSVIQNLEDAGCGQETVAQFIALGVAGERQNGNKRDITNVTDRRWGRSFTGQRGPVKHKTSGGQGGSALEAV